MLKQWIGCPPQNFSQGRKGHQPQAIVIHAYPSLEAAERLFANPIASESCHYLVAPGGIIHQYVNETDTAYHAGLTVNPRWRLYRQGVNPNLVTIGVAAAIADGSAWTAELYDSVAVLLKDIAEHWQFPLDADHIVLHAEIRASKNCTGQGFDRQQLLNRLAMPVTPPRSAALSQAFVQVISTANLRAGQPNTRAPIVRRLLAGSDFAVSGFTERGERINGNAIWYETDDNAYLWAGATDQPHPQSAPVAESPVITPSSPPLTVSSAGSGIPRIDSLFQGQSAAVIGKSEPPGDAIGAIQDLLSGHGQPGLPNIMATNYGQFGSKTVTAIRAFQVQQGLPASGEIDANTLKSLLTTRASKPRISQVYLSLVLGIPYHGLHKILSIVAQMEGVGKFGALNLNTDNAGLSYGIIQWAQRPGRLPELLRAFSASNRQLYIDIFGDGDAALADSLLAHVSKANGGVNAKTGVTLNAAFNLIARPWTDRFEQATLQRPFQIAQVQTAAQVFRLSLNKIRSYAPEISSERGIAFMLDVANQFGDGGLKKLYAQTHRPGMAEMDILDAIADESVERLPDKFKQGVRARRDGFLQTARLGDQAVDLASLG